MKVLLLFACLIADERKHVSVTCPRDGARFTAVRILRTNEWGGVDRDFCRHAYKTRPLRYYVWVCPQCRFAGRRMDFERPLSEEQRSRLKVPPRPRLPIASSAKQEDIPGDVKYDLLAQVRKALGADAREIGKAYLAAAWCCRQEGAVTLEHFDEFDRLWKQYELHQTPLQLGKRNRSDFELQVAAKIERRIAAGKADPLTSALLRYLAAYLWRRHGELAQADRWIEELRKKPGENSVVDNAVARMQESIRLERTYLKRALPYLESAARVAPEKARARGELEYVVGEIHRRLKDAAPAASWYDRALKSTPDPALRVLAREQRALVTPK